MASVKIARPLSRITLSPRPIIKSIMSNTEKIQNVVRARLDKKADLKAYMAKQNGIKTPAPEQTWLGCVVESLLNAAIADRNVNAAKLLFSYYEEVEEQV